MNLHRVSKAGDGFTTDPANSHTPESAYYFDPGVHQAEVREIFQKNWLYLGHGSQIPHEGDYLAGEIAGQQVYAVRDRDGTVRGFFNVCQHRAHQLLSGSGNIRSVIRCPYHSWTYELDGSLRSAPKCEAVANFRREDVRLKSIGVEVIG